MIKIRKSLTADTRTCDCMKVTKEQLLGSSEQHIEDVQQAMNFFQSLIFRSLMAHDRDKITDIDGFHRDFTTRGGNQFTDGEWHRAHIRLNRHHLTYPEGVPEDVNLIDVLDHIADCVMAGMGRTGGVYPLHLDSELLQRAFDNTVALLKKNVVVVEE